MSPAWIRTRKLKPTSRNPKGGNSYQVVYRRGGRRYPVESAGTAHTLKDARTRRDIVNGWLAAGLNPRVELAKLQQPAPAKLTVRAWAARYEKSRVDYSAKSADNAKHHIKKILASSLADMPVDVISIADVQDTVAWMAETLKPSSLGRYMATLRLILDYAGVDPNPARDKRVRLPSVVHEESQPPTGAHFLAMLDKLPENRRLPVVTLEQTAMAITELATLEWRDVDVAGGQFRLRRGQVKGQIRARARWVQVPGWLAEIIADSCPLEDRLPGRKVFPGVTPSAVRNAMQRACRLAGVPVYSPHDLRHRRLSLWHNQGVPVKELSRRAGHSRASMTLDVYSHVMPVDEVPESRLAALLVVAR